MGNFTRELRPDERARLLGHLLELPPADRRLRFGHAVADEILQEYVGGIDFSRDTVFVATDADLAIVGAAHLARHGEHAELGVSVLPRARGRGMGAALLERSAARACNAGVRVLFMSCLSENAPMLHLAKKQGMQVATSSGEAEAFVHLPRRSLRSLTGETVSAHLGLIDHAYKSHWLLMRGLWLASRSSDPEEAGGEDETEGGR